jgi:hypothetical protein
MTPDPHAHDDLERELGRQLHDRVDHRHDAPLRLGDIQSRAARLRRNRRLAMTAGVAAALAVIVPTAFLAGGGLSRSQEPDPVRPPGEERAAVHTRLALDGLARGGDPAIEYFTADGVVLPDRGLVEQPVSWQALIRSERDGGWIAFGPGRGEVRYLSDEFEDVDGSDAGDALVASADRSYAAWTVSEPGAQTLVLHATTDSGTDRSWDFAAAPPVEPVGVLGDDRVVFQTTNQRTGKVTVGIAEPDGSTSGFADVVDAMAVSPDGFVSVMTRSNPDNSGCFGIVDTAADPTAVAWETCENSLGVFSPDGRYVLAGPAHLDGAGDRTLAVLDARTHREVATFDQPRKGQVTIGQTTWESDDTVLAYVSDGPSEALLRFGVDGTLERATEVVQGTGFTDVAFYLGDDRVRH